MRQWVSTLEGDLNVERGREEWYMDPVLTVVMDEDLGTDDPLVFGFKGMDP